jgi:uncharacterized protein YqeY
MSLKQQIDSDLKQALLAKDAIKVSTLKMVKSAVLNEEIASGIRDRGIDDVGLVRLLKKELKKRKEASEMYHRAGSQERADKEQTEAEIIQAYLPAAMTDEELQKIVDAVVSQNGGVTQATMGQVIGQVRAQTNGQAEGGDIARLVKAKIA